MKIAVLSDIHGNVPALDAVLGDLERWAPDEVIINGDLVSRGPLSLACMELLRRRCPQARYIKGNHEEFVVASARQPCDPDDPLFDLYRFAQWTARQIDGEVEVLDAWPDHFELTDIEGGSFHITHGSRLGNRDGIRPDTADADLSEKLGDPRDLFVGSHTHRPLLRRYNGTLVVNTGSVGQPFDGDHRAAYGQFTFHNGCWQAEIARVAFDKARASRDFFESGFVEECGPVAHLIHVEFEQARIHVGPWRRQYMPAIKARQTTVAESVRAYLAALNA
ncbi:MAG: metallophosphoesterase family protein [Pseudomonadota bacterium]|nr:MAG: metallophosphoesterase family protein [Pseudomonadota bacterium]